MNSRATIALLLAALFAIGALLYLRHYVPTTHEAAELRRYAAVFDPEDIDKIDIIRGAETITLLKDGDGWRMTSPVTDHASPEAVERLLLAARFLEVRDRIAGDDPAMLTESGLSPPRLRLDLHGKQTLRLDLGADAAPTGEIFARVSGQKSILRVAGSITTPASAPVASFRDPRLTSLISDDIEKFTVRRTDGEMTLRRDRGRWTIEKPVRAPADPQAVREFLDPLLGLRITDFGSASATAPAATGLLPGETAAISLTPRGGGEAFNLEIIRRTGSDVEKSVAAKMASRGGELRVTPEALRLFDVSPEALRDRSLGFVEEDTVDRIRLKSGGETLLLQRRGNEWADPQSGKTVAASDVKRLIAAFNSARVDKFRTAVTANETGLDTPSESITFLAWLSENSAEESAGGQIIARADFGLPADNHSVYARREPADETMTVSGELPQIIRGLAGARPPETQH